MLADRALAEIVDRCLAVNPAKRFANVQAMLEALNARALQKARRPLLVLGILGPMLLLLVMYGLAHYMVRKTVGEARRQTVKLAQEDNKLQAQFAADQLASKIMMRAAFLRRQTADRCRQMRTARTRADHAHAHLRWLRAGGHHR